MNEQSVRTITIEDARRLVLVCQRLAGPVVTSSVDGLYELINALGCLQLDPISVVARSHLLVLMSRVGDGPSIQSHLAQLLWQERRLFEYWAHCASIVCTADYPFFWPMMAEYGAGQGAWPTRLRQWVDENDLLRRQILERLRAEGPLAASAFNSGAVARGWLSTGWTSGRDVSRMLDYLWIKGEIMVEGRNGLHKRWDLTERCLPDWAPRHQLTETELVRQATERSLRALGVARPVHISRHFIRGRYPGLTRVLGELVRSGRIEPVNITADGHNLPGPWYVHGDHLARLDELIAGDWQPRTTLLSPFDNLICDRQRTQQLFDFDFRIEIYTPKAKRRFGYYVLPILHGDRLIGRLDPAMDRARATLTIHTIHAEASAPADRSTARAVTRAIESLATGLGARTIEYGPGAVGGWPSASRGR